MFSPARHVPIPPVFHSSETGAPFARCLRCERELRRSGAPYLIEKAYRAVPQYDAREVVFEYALCLDCYAALAERLSADSRRRIQAYVGERADLARRARERMAAARQASGEAPHVAADLGGWLDRCLIDGTPARELAEYQLVALGAGDRLVLSHLPALVGGPALDAMAALLSAETLDELGGFYHDHLGPAPDLAELLAGPPRPAVLL